ncbi:MAG: class I SAM-dependent methyltransferase [Propionicimonas sp.]
MTSASSWTERYAAAAMVWDTTPNPHVVAVCRRLRPGTALDLGAGEGRDALWLAGRGWQVTAVDVDTLSVGRIQGRSALLNHPVNAIVADALTYKPKPAAFDLILLCHLELPQAQLHRVLSNAAPALAEGGRLVVIAHDSSNLDAGWGGPQNPDLLTTPEAVAAMLTELGLVVRRAEVVRREVPHTVGLRIALDHIVEAVRPEAA